MERMKKRTDFYDAIDKIQRQDRYIERLEEENKKLKEKLSEITMVADDEKQSIEHILELEEENRKLKEDNRFLTKISKEYMEKENIIEVTEFTELYKNDLEKENEKLKDKIKRLEFDVDAWHQLKLLLEGEIEKLKSDLDECECSFGFESDEVGFWKREYKRLKKWIKDHCKGYGNLFPEDEMKRQRKKADKKRK